MTGYAENAILSDGHLGPEMEVMTKPFVMEALAERVQASCPLKVDCRVIIECLREFISG